VLAPSWRECRVRPDPGALRDYDGWYPRDAPLCRAAWDRDAFAHDALEAIGQHAAARNRVAARWRISASWTGRRRRGARPVPNRTASPADHAWGIRGDLGWPRGL